MKTIFFKSLWSKRNDYFLVIITGILIISLVYSTAALGDCMIMIQTGRPADATESIGITESVFTFTYIFFLLLMVLMLLSYLRKRSIDYDILKLSGIQKKHIQKYVAAEYLGIVLTSVFGGILLGILETELMKKVLLHIFSDTVTKVSYGLNPIKLTMIISIIIFGIGFMICDELIAIMGIESVLSLGKKSEKIFHKSSMFSVIGILLFVLVIVTLRSYWGKVGKTVPIALALVAAYLLLISVCAIWLQNLKKRKKSYYKNILWLDGWYCRFFYQNHMTFIVAALLFVLLVAFVVKGVDHYPVMEESNYPYDIVWMANESDEEFLASLENDYQVEIERKPCIRVTTPDFGEHMGIPASEYEAWTGENITLQDDEVLIVYQREREDRNMLGIDYGVKNPRIHIGKAEWDLWIAVIDIIPSARFDTRFQVAGEKDCVLTGVFESRATGNLYGNVFEDIIVFSDSYYHSVKNQASGADLAVLMNVPKNYEEVRAKVCAYAKDHSEVNFFDDNQGNLIYEKKELLLESKQQKLYHLTSAVLNALTLYFCAVLLMLIKMENEMGELKQKYQFYTLIGMPKTKRKKLFRKEVLLSAKIMMISVVVPTVCFTGVDVAEKHLDTMWNLHYLKIISIVILGCFFLLLFIIWMMERMMWKKMEGGR